MFKVVLDPTETCAKRWLTEMSVYFAMTTIFNIPGKTSFVSSWPVTMQTMSSGNLVN